MEHSKANSVLIIAIHYAISAVIGWLAYRLTSPLTHPYWALFVADAVATIYIWALGLVYKNVSFYDPYWSVAPPVMLTWWLLAKGAATPAVLLMLAAVWYWAIRLTYNWYFTFHGLGHEDWRYTKFRTQCHPFIFHLINFFGLNMVPTIVVFLGMIPAFGIIDCGGLVNMVTIIGFAVCIAAVTIQLISDRQAHRFRSKNPGQVCRVGLWKHGRHPNYFGEILMWWGLWILWLPNCSSGQQWFIVGPISITLLFCFISVPLMEQRQLANKPEYSDYKKSTRMFI